VSNTGCRYKSRARLSYCKIKSKVLSWTVGLLLCDVLRVELRLHNYEHAPHQLPPPVGTWMSDLPSISPELAKETARNIQEALLDLRRLAEIAGFGMIAHFLNMAIIEANHFARDENVIELREEK
jgi:hypothetical protein